MVQNTDVFERAFHYAAEKHSGQTRKLSETPYILHPAEVAAIMATMTDDHEVLAAGMLHDVVEDTDTTMEEIEKLFGRRVALLVMTETEEKRPDRPASETWKLRKVETLLMLQNTKDPAVKILWLGDKLSNIRSFYRQIRRGGLEMFKYLNQKDPAEHEWYYRSIAKWLEPLKEFEAYQEYIRLVDEVFDMVKEAKKHEI